ncbi:MAG: hypothetical protein ACT4PT_00465 [Methanobacteriota archaeon]
MTMEEKRRNADDPNWGLFMDASGPKDLSARKSIKVKIPLRQHIKLHALKLFSENNISEVVEAALDDYFVKLRAAEEARLGSGAAGPGVQGPPTGVPAVLPDRDTEGPL